MSTSTRLYRRDPDEATYCTRCGRELVEVEELEDYHDSKTGERNRVRWLQCPKWPSNGFMYFLRGNHTSLSVERPGLGREYR